MPQPFNLTSAIKSIYISFLLNGSEIPLASPGHMPSGPRDWVSPIPLNGNTLNYGMYMVVQSNNNLLSFPIQIKWLSWDMWNRKSMVASLPAGYPNNGTGYAGPIGIQGERSWQSKSCWCLRRIQGSPSPIPVLAMGYITDEKGSPSGIVSVHSFFSWQGWLTNEEGYFRFLYG